MRQMIGRRAFIDKAASAAMVPLMLQIESKTARADNNYLSAGPQNGISKTIKIGEKYQVPTFSKEEYKRRWQALQQLMEPRNIDCLLIINPGDLRYVANLFGIRTEEEYYCLIPRRGDPTLFVPWSELYCYAKDLSPISELVTMPGPAKTSTVPTRTVRTIGPVVKKIKDLGLEKSTIAIDSMVSDRDVTIQYDTFAFLQKELPEAKFVEACDIMVACCQIRSAAEIEVFRKAQEIGEKAFLTMVKTAKPGITEKEVLGACIGTLISSGADVDTRILYNTAHWPDPRPEEKIHQPTPAYPYHMGGTERKLQKGDIILLELYSSYGGYYSDICLPISIGKPHPDFVERFEICKGMVRVARDLLRPGSTAADIDAKLSEYVSSKLRRKVAASAALKNMTPVPRVPITGEFQPGMVIVIPPSTEWDRGPAHICGETFLTTKGAPERIGSLPTEIAVVDA